MVADFLPGSTGWETFTVMLAPSVGLLRARQDYRAGLHTGVFLEGDGFQLVVFDGVRHGLSGEQREIACDEFRERPLLAVLFHGDVHRPAFRSVQGRGAEGVDKIIIVQLARAARIP